VLSLLALLLLLGPFRPLLLLLPLLSCWLQKLAGKIVATVPGWNAADPVAAVVGVSALKLPPLLLLLLLPLLLTGGETSL
jgi:hypothetical protein